VPSLAHQARPADAPSVPAPGQRVSGAGRRIGRRRLTRQVVWFLAIGGFSNIVYAGGYLALRGVLGMVNGNLVALVVSTMVSTAANRWFTFGVHSRRAQGRHQALGLVLLGLGMAVTSGSLLLLAATTTSPSRLSELAVLAAANAAVGVVRFLTFRSVMRPDRLPVAPAG
jgi:putative flippase GtrA